MSIVARRHGIQPNQLFAWRKLASQGALTATAAEEEVVPASEYRALQAQVKELQRLLGKKTMESEILKEALEIAGGPKRANPDLVGVHVRGGKELQVGVTTRKWRICPTFKNVSGTQVGLTVDVVAFSALRAS